MSYCRFSDGDVYMYPSVYGGIECCGCRLSKSSPKFYTRTDAIKHLELHISQGHKVPKYAIERLQDEIKTMGDKTTPELEDKSKAKIAVNLITGESFTIEELLKKLEEK